jgi:transcription antitermination factor NusG
MGPTMRELCPQPNWFAVTVKHQHERSVEGALAANGVDTFLPMYRSRRRWSDRSKDLDAALFPGYIFGRFAPGDRARVLRTPGVSSIVGFGGWPAPVTSREIDEIRAALASKLPIGPWPYPKPGDRVRIEAGPLRGIEGTLLRDKAGLRLVLSVELLQRSLAVEVEAEMISPVRN